MQYPDADVLKETIDQAERTRLIAHGIANLRFVHAVLDADVFAQTGKYIDTTQPSQSPLYANRYQKLVPNIDQDTSRLAGFTIEDTVNFGGTTNNLRYNPQASDPVTLAIHEWATGTHMEDMEYSPELLTPEVIASRHYDTILFLGKTTAAYNLLQSTTRQRVRFERQSKARARRLYQTYF